MCMTLQTEGTSVKRDYNDPELLKACKTLGDYSEYVSLVKEDAFEDGRKVGLQAGRKELTGKIMKKGLKRGVKTQTPPRLHDAAFFHLW